MPDPHHLLPRPLPLGLPKAEAADFVGFEVEAFELLVTIGLMPGPLQLPPEKLAGRRIRRRVWSVDQLATAFKRLAGDRETVDRDALLERIRGGGDAHAA